MARGINKVILIGNLGFDPEIRYSQSGDAIANLRVATSESWKDKQVNKQERTEWHRVSFFKKPAEIIAEYCKKGTQIYIEGSLRTREWEKDGVKQYTTEIIGNDFNLLGGGSAGYVSEKPQGKPSAKKHEIDDFEDSGLPF